MSRRKHWAPTMTACVVKGCKGEGPEALPFCRTHWNGLPMHIAKAVYPKDASLLPAVEYWEGSRLREAMEDIADNREGTNAHDALQAVYLLARAALADLGASQEVAELDGLSWDDLEARIAAHHQKAGTSPVGCPQCEPLLKRQEEWDDIAILEDPTS